jgi:hypothetical protein
MEQEVGCRWADAAQTVERMIPTAIRVLFMVNTSTFNQRHPSLKFKLGHWRFQIRPLRVKQAKTQLRRPRNGIQMAALPQA